jgi:5-formaminoimidazole-4-carboxamide-1-beta-D-ribofuranosyl 5'-monophosphate synthetase
MLLYQFYEFYYKKEDIYILHESFKKCYDFFIKQENIKKKKIINFIKDESYFNNIEEDIISYYKNEENKMDDYLLFNSIKLSVPKHYNQISNIKYPVIVKSIKSAGGLGINYVNNKNNLNENYDPDNCIIEEYLDEYTFYSVYLELSKNTYIPTLYLKMYYQDNNSFKYFISEKIEYDYFQYTQLNEEIEKIKKYYSETLNNKYSILSIDFAMNKNKDIKIIEINNRIGIGKIAQIYNKKFKNFNRWFTILLWNNDIDKILKEIENKEIFLINFRYIPKYLNKNINNGIEHGIQLLGTNNDDLIDLYNSLN